MTPPSPPTVGPYLEPGAAALDAERTLLGALLLDGERAAEIAGEVSPEDFHDRTHAAIYRAILRLSEARAAVDPVTVAEAIRGTPPFDSPAGLVLLTEMAAAVPTAAHANHYAAIVRDRALKRRLRQAASEVAQLAGDQGLTGAEAMERAEQKLLALARRAGGPNRPEHVADIGAAGYDRYARIQAAEDKQALFGLLTGFGELDQLLTGLAPGSLTIVAARPSVGKSSLALDLARHAAAKQGKNVCLFSLEMSKEEVMDRIVAGFLGVEAWRLKKGQLSQIDFDRLGTLMDQMRQHPLYIDDDPDTSIANLRSKARRQQLERGLDLLVIDYLQLIEVTDRGAAGENRTQQVSHISRSLKLLARELGCPVVALSQLSRATEQRNPPIPILSDLRESGGLEQDGDVVLMLYREGVYNEDCVDPLATDVYVRKNRNGPTGRVSLRFYPERMSFRPAG
jgi:replicative DNA helicase